jgi:hypothetical protein
MLRGKISQVCHIKKNVIFGSTTHTRGAIHKRTWTSPDVITQNHIDLILVDERRHLNVTGVHVHRETDCKSEPNTISCK